MRESLMSSGEYTDKKKAGGRATELFKSAQKLAQETPLDTKDVIDAMTRLQTGGFKSDESELLTKLIADQATIFGSERGQIAIDAISRIKSTGKMQMGDFESLTAARFSRGDIVKNIAEKFGIKGKDDADVSKKVEKLISSGGVNSYSAINAIIATHEKGSGQIGDVAKANADSLKGAISNVKSAFSDLLQSTDIVNWPGVVAFKAFLKQVTTSLSAESESGKELLGAVQSVTDEILGGLSNISATDLSGWIRTVGKVAIEAAQGIKKIWEWVDRLIHTEGGIGEGLKDVLADMGATIGAGILKGMATGAVKGIVGGATTAAGKLIGASGDDIVGAKDELLGYLGIGGGKDEVIEKLGDSIPKLAEGGIVRKPTLAVVGEAGPEMVIPFSRFNHDAPGMLANMNTSSSGGRGGISISGVEINIEINGAGDMGDPDALARTLEPVVVDALISGLERHAMTTG
jgi:phage tail tape-measure protein